MIWTLFEILINIFEGYLILYYTKSKITICRRSFCLDTACVLCCAGFFSLFLFFDMPSVDMLVFIIPLSYSLLISKDRWFLPLFWIINLAVLFNSTIGMCSHLFSSVFSSNLERLLVPGALRFAYVIITNAILFLVIFSASQIKHSYFKLSLPLLISFFLISVCILVTEECLYLLQQSSQYCDKTLYFNISYVCLLWCSLLSILLFHFQTESLAREHRYKTEASMAAMTQQHIREFKQMYDDFNTYRHDFKHHLETLESLIACNNTLEAREYLANYHLELATSDKYFLTGNIYVDALLTAKYLTMRTHGIRFHFKSYPLGSIPIPHTEFCSILGNLLDNAIEGILRINAPAVPQTVTLSFARSHQNFHIICENPCNPQTIKRNKEGWFSSKSKQIESVHNGFGIRSIQRLIDKAEGHCSFSLENNTFRVEITIPYPLQYCESEMHYESLN